MLKSTWTEQQNQLLTKLHAEGYSFSLIAININRETGSRFSRNACIGRAQRLGLMRQLPRLSKRNHVNRLPMGGRRIPNELRLWSKQRTAPKPIMPVQPHAFLGISFLNLKEGQCRYPFGEPMLFCGQPTIEDSSYCAHCHAVCHRWQAVELAA